jgi:hypothetical protein
MPTVRLAQPRDRLFTIGQSAQTAQRTGRIRSWNDGEGQIAGQWWNWSKDSLLNVLNLIHANEDTHR